MGLMAQAFRAGFGLGEDDKHVTTVDSRGVALAAIQGLHKLVEEKDAELRRQDLQLTAMQRELEAIKARLGM
jgi:hypothetical protein